MRLVHALEALNRRREIHLVVEPKSLPHQRIPVQRVRMDLGTADGYAREDKYD